MRVRPFVLAFGPLLLLAFVLGLAGLAVQLCTQGRPFEARAWHDATTNDVVRVGMGKGLDAQHRLVGLSRAQVVALLGKPLAHFDSPEWDMAYQLSDGRGLVSTDPAWLVLRLRADDRVSESALLME